MISRACINLATESFLHFSKHQFCVTANLKNKNNLIVIGRKIWFIVADVALKTQTLIPFAQIAVHPFTQLANATREATESIIAEWKTSALACLTAA